MTFTQMLRLPQYVVEADEQRIRGSWPKGPISIGDFFPFDNLNDLIAAQMLLEHLETAYNLPM